MYSMTRRNFKSIGSVVLEIFLVTSSKNVILKKKKRLQWILNQKICSNDTDSLISELLKTDLIVSGSFLGVQFSPKKCSNP